MESIQALGRPTVNEFAGFMRISPPNAAYKVNSLVKKGYIERRQDPKDRRVVLLYPTEKALRANRAHEAFHRDMVEAVLQALTDQQTEVLVQALNAVRAYFESRKQG